MRLCLRTSYSATTDLTNSHARTNGSKYDFIEFSRAFSQRTNYFIMVFAHAVIINSVSRVLLSSQLGHCRSAEAISYCLPCNFCIPKFRGCNYLVNDTVEDMDARVVPGRMCNAWTEVELLDGVGVNSITARSLTSWLREIPPSPLIETPIVVTWLNI